jgi:hypothetical protein
MADLAGRETGTAGHEPDEFTVARIFDFADPKTGPGFAPDHAVIGDPSRRAALLGYLRRGRPVLMTTATAADVVDQGAGRIVPGTFRTDGEWIWTDAVTYYLDRHRLAPDARLTAHVEEQLRHGRQVPAADQDTAARAADYLLRQSARRPPATAWFPGRNPES